MVKLVAVAIAVALLLCGCGGGSDVSDSSRSATTVASHTEADSDSTTPTGYPSLGCDIMPQCAPVNAQETLERCPEDQLDARGREARRRLERMLARIDGIDLHNEQAYEAYDAVMTALTDLEEQCL